MPHPVFSGLPGPAVPRAPPFRPLLQKQFPASRCSATERSRGFSFIPSEDYARCVPQSGRPASWGQRRRQGYRTDSLPSAPPARYRRDKSGQGVVRPGEHQAPHQHAPEAAPLDGPPVLVCDTHAHELNAEKSVVVAPDRVLVVVGGQSLPRSWPWRWPAPHPSSDMAMAPPCSRPFRTKCSGRPLSRYSTKNSTQMAAAMPAQLRTYLRRAALLLPRPPMGQLEGVRHQRIHLVEVQAGFRGQGLSPQQLGHSGI